MATRGFTEGRTRAWTAAAGTVHHEDFLPAGPTPRIALEAWRFTLRIGPKPVKQWSWREFISLPMTSVTRDIHCVTKWSKFDTTWEGVSIDDLLADAGVEPATPYTLAHSVDGYSTNVPTKDLVGGRGMVAIAYDGKPIPSDHGGPARLLVPHLYFWKSAKWINALQFTNKDEPGFWELRGYHIYGDPWKEQRFTGD
jgi:DMSO/TMAO reductase YedYZ molybdopterin-dependent catalytic subunit